MAVESNCLCGVLYIFLWCGCTDAAPCTQVDEDDEEGEGWQRSAAETALDPLEREREAAAAAGKRQDPVEVRLDDLLE